MSASGTATRSLKQTVTRVQSSQVDAANTDDSPNPIRSPSQLLPGTVLENPSPSPSPSPHTPVAAAASSTVATPPPRTVIVHPAPVSPSEGVEPTELFPLASPSSKEGVRTHHTEDEGTLTDTDTPPPANTNTEVKNNGTNEHVKIRVGQVANKYEVSKADEVSTSIIHSNIIYFTKTHTTILTGDIYVCVRVCVLCSLPSLIVLVCCLLSLMVPADFRMEK